MHLYPPKPPKGGHEKLIAQPGTSVYKDAKFGGCLSHHVQLRTHRIIGSCHPFRAHTTTLVAVNWSFQTQHNCEKSNHMTICLIAHTHPVPL